MITGDLDLERTVWDVEYRRQVIAFLADQNGNGGTADAAARSADVIPFPRPATAPTAGLCRTAES